jgi:hypothetical protein
MTTNKNVSRDTDNATTPYSYEPWCYSDVGGDRFTSTAQIESSILRAESDQIWHDQPSVGAFRAMTYLHEIVEHKLSTQWGWYYSVYSHGQSVADRNQQKVTQEVSRLKLETKRYFIRRWIEAAASSACHTCDRDAGIEPAAPSFRPLRSDGYDDGETCWVTEPTDSFGYTMSFLRINHVAQEMLEESA